MTIHHAIRAPFPAAPVPPYHPAVTEPDDETLFALAAASGSPAVQALVLGHLAAGNPALARLALYLSPETVARLDAEFAAGLEAARIAGAAAALAAHETDGD